MRIEKTAQLAQISGYQYIRVKVDEFFHPVFIKQVFKKIRLCGGVELEDSVLEAEFIEIRNKGPKRVQLNQLEILLGRVKAAIYLVHEQDIDISPVVLAERIRQYARIRQIVLGDYRTDYQFHAHALPFELGPLILWKKSADLLMGAVIRQLKEFS